MLRSDTAARKERGIVAVMSGFVLCNGSHCIQYYESASSSSS